MKIYKIIADLPDGRFMCYIGSTKNKLSDRLKGHRNDFKQYINNSSSGYCSSFELLKKPWYEIILVEDLGNCSKEYMLDKENYYIDYYKSLSDEYLVVNKHKPNCTDFNKRDLYHKNYNIEYQKSEKRRDYLKKYRQTNQYKEYMRLYYLKKNTI